MYFQVLIPPPTIDSPQPPQLNTLLIIRYMGVFWRGLILGGREPYTLNLGGWGCFKITPRTLHSWPTSGWSSKIEALIVGAGDPEP